MTWQQQQAQQQGCTRPCASANARLGTAYRKPHKIKTNLKDYFKRCKDVTHTHTHIHTYIHTYTHTYTHIYIYIYIYSPIMLAVPSAVPLGVAARAPLDRGLSAMRTLGAVRKERIQHRQIICVGQPATLISPY